MKRGTLLFSGFVALVVAYAIYDYKSDKAGDEKRSQQSLLLQMKADQIQQISIQNQSAKIEVVREKEGWRLTEPVQDQTNESVVSEFIDGLVSEKYSEVAIEGGDLNLASFGLDQPLGKISVQDNTGKRTQFSVGTIKNFQGDAFIRVDENPQVLVVSSTWFSKLQKTAADFRDRRWMRMPMAGVFKMEFGKNSEKGLEKFNLEKREDSWVSPEQISWKLDQNKVRELITMLGTTEGIEVISDSQRPAKSEESKKWGMDKPRMHLKVFLRKGTEEVHTWEGKISMGSDQIHRIETSPPNFVYKISPTDSDKFSHLSLDALRDRTEPFQFEKEKVKKIIWSKSSDSSNKAVAKDAQGTWKSTEGDIDSEKVMSFLNQLSKLRVGHFMDHQVGSLSQKIGGSNQKGLRPGQQTGSPNPIATKWDQEISLLGEDEKELFKMRWVNLKKGEWEVQTSSYSGFFSVGEADIQNLQIEQVFKKIEVKK